MSFIPAPLPLYKLIEDATSASLREISHLLPLWFWETNADYVLTYVSDNIERLTGFSARDLEGVCILNPIYGRGEAEAGLGDYHDALRRREPIKSYSYERILLTGERVVLLDSAIPQFDEDGAFKGYCGVSFHLSNAIEVAGLNGSLVASLKDRADALEVALSQRNAELASSNRLLAEVLDALGEGLLVTSGHDPLDPKNKILFMNPAFRSLMSLDETDAYPGMTAPELRKSLAKRIETSAEKTVERTAQLGDGKIIEMELPRQQRNLEVKGLPRPDGGMVLVYTDVTELKARTHLLEQARRDAESATEAKSNFLASMSHEIRTPMNGIIGVAELLAETSLDTEQAEYVDTIRRSALALTGLIGDILDFSKIEAGHLALASEPVELTELVRDMVGMMTPMAQAKNISFTTQIDDALPKAVLGDKQRLRQILINLLGNAIKFTGEGGVTLRMRSGNKGIVLVDVDDTGVGIPSQSIGNVFNSFEQVQNGYQRAFEGTGLGLAITRELVEAMGGDITVRSRFGEGSTFSLVLPLQTTARSAAAKVQIESKPLDLSSSRILLAEDNLTNQFVVKKMLQGMGGVPIIVGNGQEACDALQEGTFDLVLMDISMPVMSGIDATREIRAYEQRNNRPRCPIVALTGNAFDTDRRNCLAAGMDGFLTKPILKDQLIHCLKQVLLAPA